MSLTQISANRVFGGWHKQYTHHSTSVKGEMRFAVFLPPQASEENKVPALYWLSGLTCSDENFMQKAGAFNAAAELGIAIIAPDTSPRGEQVADDQGYDLGQGAGFYLNATQAPWNEHFHMESYVSQELPQLIEDNFPISAIKSISGHSMGGHGAITLGLKNHAAYRSISAFSPICNPSDCPWGIKAFSAYLGDDQRQWSQYDASKLIAIAETKLPLRIDQGLADNFLSEQLKPESLLVAAKANNYPVSYYEHDDYDHSYYFISSFIEQHLAFHAKYLFAV